MSFRLSPESINSLRRIDEVRQTFAQIVAEMDDDSALVKTMEQAALSEEQIFNIQKAYFNAVEPLAQSDALLNVAQQQTDLRESLIEIADTIDDVQTIQVRTLRPLFETESVQNAIDNPADAVEEYGEPEAVPKPGEVTLSADQEGARIAWGTSVIAANQILKAGQDQIGEASYSIAQLRAAIMLLGVILLYGAFGPAAAAPIAFNEAFSRPNSFADAWEDTVNRAEETVEEFESDNSC